MKKGSAYRIKSLLKNHSVRLRLSLIGGLAVNLAYLALNILPALLYGSAFAVASTAYYLVIIIMRIVILARRHTEDNSAYRTLFHVGILLLLLDLAIIGMLAYTATRGRILPYSPYFVIGYAAFTVYSLTVSLVGIVRSVRKSTPITLAARNLTLTVALTSSYSLQHSILSSVGASAEAIRAAGIISATVISLTVPTVAAAMIAIGASRTRDQNHPHPTSRV